MRDRHVQLLAAATALAAFVGAGALLPVITRTSDEAKLRYTDVSVEGAPPIVAVGAAVGALRGLVVDYLWIRLQQMRQDGHYYDAQRLADLITKLQPRFGEVWAFHGHNLAYNLSVMTSTPEERWRLVNAGIDLVRNKGLRYNPNDLILYKELAFWFAHKIDGVSDDAHLFYKRKFAQEWHLLLGPPPADRQERVKWLEAIATSPDTFDELLAKNPDVKKLADELTERLKAFDPRVQFRPDKSFLMNEGQWMALRSNPGYARMLKLHDRMRQTNQAYAALDDVLSKPENRVPLAKLVAYLRKHVLLDDYNMDPALMARYTKEYGPFDWRHPQSHAFYWARRGSEIGAERYQNDDDIYRIMNDDSTAIQAMQSLAHSGLMSVDPFSEDNPGRLQDTRWIRAIDSYFRELYDKHYKTRGAGADRFVDFHINFMTQAIRELYRAGDEEGAQQILDELDKLYGRGGLIPNNKYSMPLEDYVRQATFGEYEMVPDVARTDVYGALRRGFLEGYLLERKKTLDDALKFSRDLIEYFRTSRFADFQTKMGDRRLADLVGGLERSVEFVLADIMTDSEIPLVDRLTIYNKLPEDQRAMVYDPAKERLAADYAASPMASVLAFDKAFPEPPGIEAWRARKAELERERKSREAERQQDGSERKR